MKLNLGCNVHPKVGYVNVDIEPYPWVNVVCDLEKTWPWEDDSIDEVLAEDIFEHLKHPMHTMNELYRVLKPGGHALVKVPSTDGKGAFQDPTHVSFWNENSFLYYIAHPDENDKWGKGPLANLYPQSKACFRMLISLAEGAISAYGLVIPYVVVELKKVRVGDPVVPDNWKFLSGTPIKEVG